MIRLSIGIEHIDDIIDDLDHALGRAVARPSALVKQAVVGHAR